MWYHRTVRLRPQAINLSSYLQNNIPNMRPSDLFDMVITDKINELEKNTYIIGDYDQIRQVKGVKLREETISKLDHFLATHKNLLKAEVFEICLYIFAKDHLSEDEMNFFNLKEWHVRKR